MDNQFLEQLTPTQEHFLKKFLIEQRLEHELTLFSRPDCLELLGPPFRTGSSDGSAPLPLVKFFFKNYITNFPFVTNNPRQQQLQFWQDTVQPFVESLNSKHLSNSNDRKEHITKRKQVNYKLLSGLSLFFNSMIVTPKELKYLESDHLAPSDVSKLDKINKHQTPLIEDLASDDDIVFTNGHNVNIVAVQRVSKITQTKGWFGITHQSVHHFEFIIQVINEHGKHYISRPYHEFKALEQQLVKKFPGIMNIETSKLPEKFKNDAHNLVKEKLRLSLRGYLSQLLKFPEIIASEEFQEFFTRDSFKELSEEVKQDAAERRNHERQLLLTQLEFQRQMSNIMHDFYKRFDEFKILLIKNPHTLMGIFEEIGANETMDNLSPLLKIFLDWCKIEVSATVFQVFLTQDNSTELLNNLRKFHRLFPYGMMYNILRFTNPMSIISKVINLLLITIPGTGKTLLSYIFIMLLDDDLNGYEIEIKEVKEKLASYPNIVAAIERFIDDELVDSVLDIEQNIVLVINSLDKPTSLEKSLDIETEKDVFNNLKQLYQLKIRQNDKKILKTLWEEPELTALLKNFLIIFYQPLIKLLSKAKMHIFFKDFQNFNSDLIKLLVSLSEEGVYYLSSVEIFNQLMKLLDDNIIIFWRFIHNLYKNDKDQLFSKLIKWIEGFLIALRLKYSDIQKVQIDLTTVKEPINKEVFFAQLNAKINKIVQKRQLYKDYNEKIKEKGKTGAIDKNWDTLHEKLNEADGDFGIDLDEVQDFNFEVNNSDDLELQKKLQELENKEYPSSELHKFDSHLIHELDTLFQAY